MKINFIFAWYDFWIGVYYDRKLHRIYFLPVPCFGIVVQLRRLHFAKDWARKFDFMDDDDSVVICPPPFGDDDDH